MVILWCLVDFWVVLGCVIGLIIGFGLWCWFTAGFGWVLLAWVGVV